MQKIFTPRLIIVLLVTAGCLFVTWPTMRYFIHINTMGEEPTEAQIERRNELLESPGVITLGLDLQGGADFLLTVDQDLLARRILENQAEGLREAFRRDAVDASVSIDFESIDDMSVRVQLNDERDLDFATETLEDVLGTSVELSAQGNIRNQLAQSELLLVPPSAELQESLEQAVESALRVIRRRVDEFGLTQPIVARAGPDRILVQIPGENDPERIRESLLRTAAMEFRLLHPNHEDLITEFVEDGADGVVQDGTGPVKREFLEEVEEPATGRTVMRLQDDIPGVPSGYTLRLGRRVHIDPVTGTVDPERSYDDLAYLVEARAPIVGEHLRRAAVFTDPMDHRDPIKVTIDFNRQGADLFARITSDNVGRRFAIILDDVVYSAPNIREPILGGSAQISGGFSQAEALDLSRVLNAGALPAPLQVITENTVGPTLGAESIRNSARALIIGAALIVVLMVFMYVHAGIISIFAMTLNLLLIMAILGLMGATLTLSGIGGILLTMGMAVDANILIYERLREELDSGKPLRAAINQAFDKAFSVIVDSNTTSLLPALVLVLFEVVDGSVKGFWTAIAIGLIANLYTGIVVTRTLMETWYTQFRSISVGKLRLLKNVRIPWMKYRAVGIGVSGTLAIVAAGYLIIEGPSWGIDFTGGVLTTVEIQDTQGEDRLVLLGMFEDQFDDVRAIRVVGQEQWQLTVPRVADRETGEVPTLDEIRGLISERIGDEYGERAQIMSTQSVEPFVGTEFRMTAFMTMLVACAVILSYIAFRFQWVFGAGAVITLLHDVFLALGLFKLLGHTLTLDIVSALLIILGYSVNDTIVVFDRIREKMQERHSAKLFEVFNRGINETLSRTLMTSTTTLTVVGLMFLFGGAGLSAFALVLLIGIALGTYSSIFVASALVYTYLNSRGITTAIQAKKATTRVALPKAKKAPAAGQQAR